MDVELGGELTRLSICATTEGARTIEEVPFLLFPLDGSRNQQGSKVCGSRQQLSIEERAPGTIITGGDLVGGSGKTRRHQSRILTTNTIRSNTDTDVGYRNGSYPSAS
jgi:hypothetical protein